jgi:hypothetical protein
MCATLAHGHPAIVEAIREAAGRVVEILDRALTDCAPGL